MKFTAEQRKHLVTRTFTENAVSYETVDFASMKSEKHSVKIGGKFENETAMKEYVFKKYNDFNAPINPMTIQVETREVKYAMYDYDFMRYGFILTDDENAENAES